MQRTKIHNVTLEITQGNIIQQPEIDAIVNAANAELRTGGGVAGAIHGIGDPDLREETKKLAPIKPGMAVISSAPNFPNSHIIHVLGPVYGQDKPEDELLASCYTAALNLADERKLRSIAFPAISTGAFGYPIAEAAHVALRTVAGMCDQLKHIWLVRFVLFGESDAIVFGKALEEVRN